jgi:arginine/ornithine N-succinyltransferase beta subunit
VSLLVSNTDLADFRVTLATGRLESEVVDLDRAATSSLEAGSGAPLRVAPAEPC